MQVVVNELLTNYSVNGKGKTVLLIHGWGDTMQGLAGLHKELARDYQVISLDLPGFGNTQRPKEIWGLNDYAKFIADFLKKIQISKINSIVAHSNGGAISIRGIAKKILNPDKLVLIASSGIRDTYRGRVKVIRLVTKAGKLVTMPLPKNTKTKIRKFVYKTVGSDMLVVEGLQKTFKKVVTDDIQEDAKTIQTPTLLIYGSNDSATPVIYGRALHELMPNSTLEIINDASHFVHLDQPGSVSNLILDFLK